MNESAQSLLPLEFQLYIWLARLSPLSLKQIAIEMGITSENLLASFGGRRPMPHGERLAKLRSLLGINPTTGRLSGGRVHFWMPKERSLADLVEASRMMFPSDKPAFRTDLIFDGEESCVYFCLHSDAFLLLLAPCVGLSLEHLQFKTRPHCRVPHTLRSFCDLPADVAQAVIQKGKPTWADAVEFLKNQNVSPEWVMELVAQNQLLTPSRP